MDLRFLARSSRRILRSNLSNPSVWQVKPRVLIPQRWSMVDCCHCASLLFPQLGSQEVPDIPFRMDGLRPSIRSLGDERSQRPSECSMCCQPCLVQAQRPPLYYVPEARQIATPAVATHVAQEAAYMAILPVGKARSWVI